MNKAIGPFVSAKPGRFRTGLGLSISYGILTDHGGAINIDSIMIEYTKVTVYLLVNKLKNVLYI